MDRTPYRVALRLYSIAVERWALIDATYLSVDLLSLPAHRFLNAVYAWCVERIDPEKLEEWEFQLQGPLPWETADTVTQAQVEDEGETFMAFMGQMTGGG